MTTCQKYGLDFARSGSPNRAGLPQRPKYDAATDPHLMLVNPPAVGSGSVVVLAYLSDPERR